MQSPSYLRQLLDRPDRIRDVDALLAVAARERFDEFVFQEELVVEVAAVQDDVEVDARLAEGGEAHERRLLYLAVDARDDFVGHLERDLFHEVEVAVVGDADGDADGHVERGHAEVRDVRGGDLLVRDDDHVAAARRHDGREAPGDVRHAAFLAGAEPDVVAEAQLFREDEVQAGEDVGECLLQREGDRHAADAHRG